MDNFPAICTFLQNPQEGTIEFKIPFTNRKVKIHYTELIQLTNAQANLLASQAYWMASNSDLIKKALGGLLIREFTLCNIF